MLGIGSKVRSCLVAAVLVAGFLSAAAPSHAAILVEIEKSTQTMYVTVSGVTRQQWPVSTGRGRIGTPNGVFRPLRLERRWFSRRYYNSPMPYSVFFHKGYAIHGTTELSRLGGPASHGCVRLHPRNAATLFSLVQGFGPERTRIVVMAGLVPGNHVFLFGTKDLDARHHRRAKRRRSSNGFGRA